MIIVEYAEYFDHADANHIDPGVFGWLSVYKRLSPGFSFYFFIFFNVWWCNERVGNRRRTFGYITSCLQSTRQNPFLHQNSGDKSLQLINSCFCQSSGTLWKQGGRPGLPISNSPYDLCGRQATLNSHTVTNFEKDNTFRRTAAEPHNFILFLKCQCFHRDSFSAPRHQPGSEVQGSSELPALVLLLVLCASQYYSVCDQSAII